MTISNVNRFVQAGGNGVTVVFPFNFKVFQSTDVAVVTMVTSTGVQTTPVLGVDYTVTISGDQNYSAGGNVTFTTAPLTGVRITISSLVPNLQPTDLSNQGGFYPDVINDSFDRSTIQIQQVGDIAARSLSVAQSEQGVTSLALPPIAVRANKYLAFDGGGTPMAATGTNTPGISYAGNVELTANNAGTNVARDVVFYDNLTERMRLTGSTGALNVTGALTVANLGVSGALTAALACGGFALTGLGAPTTQTGAMRLDDIIVKSRVSMAWVTANGAVTGSDGTISWTFAGIGGTSVTATASAGSWTGVLLGFSTAGALLSVGLQSTAAAALTKTSASTSAAWWLAIATRSGT